jgi:hypothetical protein
MKDDERNPIIIEYSPQLSFINLIDESLVFNPNKDSDLGDYVISITISDG